MDVSLEITQGRMDKNHLIAIAFGLVAFALGSVSTELWNGGDAKISGVDGVLAIDGFHFFQMLISLICWGWFAYQAWVLFPVMRIHAISLLVMWNGMVWAQVFFFRTNPSFPLGLDLASMMEGTLILLVVFFFLFFFWKAVVETRDLHVEVNHLHEDVASWKKRLQSIHSEVGPPCWDAGCSSSSSHRGPVFDTLQPTAITASASSPCISSPAFRPSLS